MAELQVPELTMERAYKLGINTYVGLIEALFQAMAEKLSPEEMKELLVRTFYEQGKRFGFNAPSKLGISGNDALAIASFVHLSDEAMRIKGHVVEAGPDRVEKHIKKCPMQHISVNLCYASEALLQGVVEAINPEYKASMPKTIGLGDSICQVIIERK